MEKCAKNGEKNKMTEHWSRQRQIPGHA